MLAFNEKLGPKGKFSLEKLIEKKWEFCLRVCATTANNMQESKNCFYKDTYPLAPGLWKKNDFLLFHACNAINIYLGNQILYKLLLKSLTQKN